jgi:isoamylase
MRAFWRGDDGKLPELAARLTASADLFAKRGRKPWPRSTSWPRTTASR